MKNLVIIPRFEITEKVNYIYTFPIGVSYIIANIKKNNFPLDCLNLNHVSGKIKDILKNYSIEKYDNVLLGGLALDFLNVKEVINSIRELNPPAKIILGGLIISTETEIIFNALNPDIAIIGEGEITIIEVLKCIQKKENLEKIKGIAFKKNGKIIFTEPRKFIRDLDSLPFPDYKSAGLLEQIGKMEYPLSFVLKETPRIYPLITGRGCPFNCTFCFHHERKFRIRSLDNVFEEIKRAIKDFNANFLWFYDDTFALNEKRIYEFCNRIKKIRIKKDIKWICQLTVHNSSKEILRTLKDAGCIAVSWGFESFSSPILKSMNKPITPEQIDKAIKNSMEVGLSIQGNFLFGDISETEDTYKETLEYWKKNCKGQVRLNFIQPYPGSTIWDHCIKEGIIKDKLDYIMKNMRHTVYLNMTKNMSDQKYNNMKKEIFKLRTKHFMYITPEKIVKVKDNFYEVIAKCPFCNKPVQYNVPINNKTYYDVLCACPDCDLIFFIVSPLRKFEVLNYNLLEPLRRNYLLLKEYFLKQKELY